MKHLVSMYSWPRERWCDAATMYDTVLRLLRRGWGLIWKWMVSLSFCGHVPLMAACAGNWKWMDAWLLDSHVEIDAWSLLCPLTCFESSLIIIWFACLLVIFLVLVFMSDYSWLLSFPWICLWHWEATCRDGLLDEGEDEQFSARIHELFTWYFTLSRVSRLSCDGSNGNGHGAACLGILIGTYWQWRIFNIGTLTILALRESVSLRKLPKSTVCSMRWKPRVLFDEQPVSMRRKPPSMRWLSGYLRVVIRVSGSTRLSEVLPW